MAERMAEMWVDLLVEMRVGLLVEGSVDWLALKRVVQ